jgi:glutamine synthetase
MKKICEAFRPVTAEHIAVYGAYNDLRLTGKHETASMTSLMAFLIEVSIRIPLMTVQKDGKDG